MRQQVHPTLPYVIANYTETCQYERVWDEVTTQCRGLIYRAGDGIIIARSFPKFFNYGEHEEGTLDLEAPVQITDKLDGSLGILYPTTLLPHTKATDYAVATRGSFTSDQAVWATEWLHRTFPDWQPFDEYTYLFEIIAPWNRVVVDYADRAELVLLGCVHTVTGRVFGAPDLDEFWWPGSRVHMLPGVTLLEALELPPRKNAEGIVVRFLYDDTMVKVKQDDYVALHRIITGTNARRVWEMLAVRVCSDLITERKHWGSYLKIDPDVAEQLLGSDVTPAGLPDEFHAWLRDVEQRVMESVGRALLLATTAVERARKIEDRRSRYEFVHDVAPDIEKEVMRMVDGKEEAKAQLTLKAWLLARPEPEAPFNRSEDNA